MVVFGMKKRLDLAWFNFVQLFQWHRVLGIGSLCIVAYVLVFFVFAKSDVTGFLPPRYVSSFHWPDLPRFFVAQDDSKTSAKETIYTVPTRKITAQELSQIQNPAVAPASTPAPASR